MKMAKLSTILASCCAASVLAWSGATAQAGLVLHSSMDNADISGTTVFDSAAPAEDGTLRNDGTVTTGATGQIGEAIDAETTGSAAALDYGDVLDVGSGVQTISVWFNGTGVTKDQYLARKGNTSSGAIGWSIFLDDRLPQTGQSQYQATFRANATGGTANADKAVALILLSPEDSVNTWIHLAMVVDSINGTVTGYVNGSSAGTTTNAWGTTFTPGNMSSSASLLLGTGTSAGTNTLIDDFAIFDHGLSPAEVQDIYTNGLAGIAVPEPATLCLAATGLVLLVRRTHR